jgi:hypothetical protein
MRPETAATIEASLPEPLLKVYREQVMALMKAVTGRDEAAALELLQGAMTQSFVQGYGLPFPEAAALSRLAVTNPPRVEGMQLLHAALERCALQRCLLVAQMGPHLSPFFQAAGGGALEGFAQEAENVIDPYELTRPRPNIPTLRPVHSQDESIEDVAPSPFFTEKWS